jgi:hypothetical protein
MMLAMQWTLKIENHSAKLILNRGPVTWLPCKQPYTTSFKIQPESLKAHTHINELLWELRLLNKLSFLQRNPTIQYSDQPTIHLVQNPNQQTKHMYVPYHVIHKHQANQDINITYLSIHQQVANIVTKALAPNRFIFL